MSTFQRNPVNKNPALVLRWVKSTTNTWLSFERVDLSKVVSTGVYIIWHAGSPGRVVYVGQGDIASRISCHRSNLGITSYSSRGQLYVTWASVRASQLDGVERYLADMLKPLVGDAYPVAAPVAVNSPWG